MMPLRIAGALVDLSGTLHVGSNLIPRSVEALQKLRSQGVKVHFLSNTTKETKTQIVRRLQELNLDIHPNEVTTALSVARQVCIQSGLRPFLFVTEDAADEFKDIEQSDPNAVVMGLAPAEFHYEKLNKAFRMLLGGADLYAIHKARYYKVESGLDLGPGGFVECLEYSSGVKAKLLGKPSAEFFKAGLKSLGCASAEDVVMIGDDVRIDVKPALDLGMKGVLVKTGKYMDNDETKYGIRPDFVAADFSHAVDWIIQYNTRPAEEKL